MRWKWSWNICSLHCNTWNTFSKFFIQILQSHTVCCHDREWPCVLKLLASFSSFYYELIRSYTMRVLYSVLCTQRMTFHVSTKGQLISKCLFVVFNYPKRQTTWGTIVVKSHFFFRFLGELKIQCNLAFSDTFGVRKNCH